ncbi:MAG TPA: RIP metalloprotease RseP [Legionellales bacterium]|nr:RIP metalloprotease RseP [Legionellales bacterium]
MSLSVVFLLSLVLMIVFHELGHFLVARLFRVAIARFSIGFGPALLSWTSKKHLTKFTLSPILLGGYVKFSDKSFQHHHRYEDLRRWKKICILLAGPFANVILAMFLMVFVMKMERYEPIAAIGKVYPQSVLEKKGITSRSQIIRCNDISIHSWPELERALDHRQANLLVIEDSQGMRKTVELPATRSMDLFFKTLGFEPYIFPMPAIVGGFSKDSPAQKQGLLVGDEIKKINENLVQDLNQLSLWIKQNPNKTVNLEIIRHGQKQSLSIRLGEQVRNHLTYGLLGITALPFSDFPQWFQLNQPTWWQAINDSFNMTWKLSLLQLHSWGQVQDVLKQVSGPVGMVRTAQEAWSMSTKAYLLFLSWLSIGVGMINLFPIPILDGGQCLLLLVGKFFPAIEKEKYKKFLFLISFVLILSLMTVGLINDGLS